MQSTLITGANRGLGQYVADGWQVYAGCRNPDSATELRRLADTSSKAAVNMVMRSLAIDLAPLA